jgi:hypothetical protein
MAQTTLLREGDNAFERTVDILGMIYQFPDEFSDEELACLADYLQPDIRNTVMGLFVIESARIV